MQRNVTSNSFSGWVEYLNTSGRTFSGDLIMGSSHRAPIFYDSNDTSYYIDPNSTSRLNTIRGVTELQNFAGNRAVRLDGTIWTEFCDPSGTTKLWLGNASDLANYYNNNTHWFRNSSSTIMAYIDGNGIVSNGNVTAYSDIKLKDNIETIPDAVNKVKQVRGVTYTRKDLEDKQKRYSGVIAQEVEAVLPEVVGTNEEGTKHVAYGNMVGLLIEAIKEQQTQIEELTSQINTLKEMIK
jgi:hypothetical protein